MISPNFFLMLFIKIECKTCLYLWTRHRLQTFPPQCWDPRAQHLTHKNYFEFGSGKPGKPRKRLNRLLSISVVRSVMSRKVILASWPFFWNRFSGISLKSFKHVKGGRVRMSLWKWLIVCLRLSRRLTRILWIKMTTLASDAELTAKPLWMSCTAKLHPTRPTKASLICTNLMKARLFQLETFLRWFIRVFR